MSRSNRRSFLSDVSRGMLAAGLGAAAGGFAGGRLSPRVPERARSLLIATVAVAAALVALLRLVA